MGRWYEAAKRALDVVVASGTLVATAPLLGAAALAVRATMGAPVMFRQPRSGRHGVPFELIKLRTMKLARRGESYESDGRRLTRLGGFLRASSIDELPTLWHVVRGEMSLVGPRPHVTEYLDRYSPEQRRRLDVKPGVTGWNQIRVRNAATWDEKFANDVWYVDHRGFWLDLMILVRTAGVVLARTGISQAGEATTSVFMGPARTGSGVADPPIESRQKLRIV